MTAPTATAPTRANLMSGDAYRESLRGYHPKVYVDGREVELEAGLPLGLVHGVTYTESAIAGEAMLIETPSGRISRVQIT